MKKEFNWLQTIMTVRKFFFMDINYNMDFAASKL